MANSYSIKAYLIATKRILDIIKPKLGKKNNDIDTAYKKVESALKDPSIDDKAMIEFKLTLKELFKEDDGTFSEAPEVWKI